MAKHKQESEALQDAQTDAAAQGGGVEALPETGNQASRLSPSYSDSPEYRQGFQDGHDAVWKDRGERRSRASMDIFHSLVHGMRVNVTPDMLPGDVAERLGMIHDKILLEMEERGVIEPLAPAVPGPVTTE